MADFKLLTQNLCQLESLALLDAANAQMQDRPPFPQKTSGLSQNKMAPGSECCCLPAVKAVACASCRTSAVQAAGCAYACLSAAYSSSQVHR